MASRNEILDAIVALAVGALESGLPDGAANFLAATGVPPEAIQDLGGDALMRAVGCQRLIMWQRSMVGDLVGATRLSFALAEHLLRRGADADPWMLSNVLSAACSVGVDAGSSILVRQCALDWAARLDAIGRNDGARDVRLKYAEAALNQGDYEDARRTMDREPDVLPDWLQPIWDRLYGKTGLLCRPDETVVEGNPAAILAATLQWLKAEMPDAHATHVLETTPLDQLTPAALDVAAFPAPPADLAGLLEAARTVQAHRSPLFALKAILEACPAYLVAGQSEAAYVASRDVARAMIAAADQFQDWEQGTTARWLEVIALRRLKQMPEALECLHALGRRVDECRARISDPQLRAGIAIWLPHLSWITAETAMDVGDGAALLHAVETAKARILGDLRPGPVAGPPPGPADFLSRTLGCLAAGGQRRHLLAYLVDTGAPPEPGTAGVLAVLLTSAGALHTRRIVLTQTQIAGAARLIQRRVRGGGSLRAAAGIDPAHPDRTPFDDFIASLAPLVTWLEPLVEQNVIRADDTVLISPDGPIHNIPFAMLPLCGAPMIEHVAIVNIPSAALLLSRSPAPRPSSALALLKPSRAELDRGEDYAAEGQSLAALLPTTILPDGHKLAEELAAHAPCLLHVSAHGEDSAARPLKDKGLALAGDSTVWLTAEEVRRLPLVGAHVGIRACLCGVVTQITSREALGMVWAMLGAGTASLSAALWSVDIGSASTFLAHFYAVWIGGKHTRADAHRSACRALRAQGGALAHPFHYAPFVLTASTIEGDIA